MNNILMKCESIADIPEFMKQIMARSMVTDRIVTDSDLLAFVNSDLRIILANCHEILMRKKLSKTGFDCWCIYTGAIKVCMTENKTEMSLTAILNNRKYHFVSGTFYRKKKLMDILVQCGMFTETGTGYIVNRLDVPWLDFDKRFFGGK